MEALKNSAPATIAAVYVPGNIAPDPEDPAWAQAPEAVIKLSRRLNEIGARVSFLPGEERSIRVKAVHNGEDIFFLCRWDAREANTAADDYDLFPDAFAMEFPLIAEESPLCMGSTDKPVNIIHWRADLPKPENIVAGGVGTTQMTHNAQNIRHCQKWSDGMWSVIISRPMAAVSNNQVTFKRGANRRIAFANWKGGQYAERGGHKIVSEWQLLSVE